MRCASYTRLMSITDREDIPSNIIAQQNEKITSYIKERHWKLVVKYSDRKKDVEDESAFIAMKDGAIAREFDCLVMASIFRCGRNTVVAAEVIKNMLLPVGIHFAVVEDNFCSADVSLEDAISYLDLKQAEFRSSRSIRSLLYATEHRVYEKYGYLHKDGKMELEIDPSTEKCIQKMYELVIEGLTFSEVANKLNEEGYESYSQHMKRIKHKLPEGAYIPWDAPQVSQLIRNRLYKGEWVRTIDGEKQVVSCPAIVSEEVFQKAKEEAGKNAKNISNARKKSVSNAYAKRVFDLETGERLKVVDQLRLKTKIYRFSYPREKAVQYERSYILWSDLDRMVKDAIYEECKKAKFALSHLTDEIISELKEEKLSVIHEKAKQVFDQMVVLENQQMPLYDEYVLGMISEPEYILEREKLLQKQRELDDVLTGYMEEAQMLETAYSKNNPWIKLFANWKMPDLLKMIDVGKIIERIDCRRFERVFVTFRHELWKAYLPTEWM